MGSFNLSKGERFSLSKAAPGLTIVRIGMGWDPNEEPNGPDFDLDVSAFAIGSNFKIPSDSYFVFYGQVRMGNSIEDSKEKGFFRPITDDKSILGAIDDPNGKRSDGDDDEDMIIDLTKVNDKIEQIIICASICKYPNDNKKDRRTLDQNFGMVDDCYIRIVNESTGEEILRFNLAKESTTSDAIEFGRLFRVGNNWEFEAMARTHTGSLQTLVDMYT